MVKSHDVAANGSALMSEREKEDMKPDGFNVGRQFIY